MMLVCSFCDGVGKMEGPEICPDCKGKGRVRSTCEHEWEDLSKDLSRSYQDQICIKCGIKQMQAAAFMEPVAAEVMQQAAPPLVRDDDFYTVNMGNDTKVTIRREDLIKQLQRDLFQSAMLPGSLFDRRS